MSTLEHGEQVAFVRWFRATFPGVRIFAIPNGGHRAKREAQRLVEEGVSAGVPDLYVPAWRLWVEMKREKGGTVSDEQSDWLDYLQTIGDSVILGRGFEDARAQVVEFISRQTALTVCRPAVD